MFHTKHAPHTWLATIIGAISIFTLINPIAQLDILIFTIFFLVIGELYLKEKLLLVFMILRPAIDYWRDVQIFTYNQHSITLTSAFALLVICWGGYTIIRRHKYVRHIPAASIAIAVTTFFFASVLYSVAPSTTLIEATKFLSCIMLFAVAYTFVKQQKITLPSLAISLALSSIVPILVAMSQLVFGSGLNTFEVKGRIYGTLGHPNVFAFFIMSLFIIFIHYSSIIQTSWWEKNKELRTIGYIGCSFLMLFTYTRAALIGLGVFILIIGTMKYKRALIVTICSVVIFYTGVTAVDYVFSNTGAISIKHIGIINRLTSRDEDADSIAWRNALIRETTPIILEEPLRGYGYGTFPSVWEENRGEWHLFDDSAESHNDYLRLLLETGVVGFSLYVLLIAALLYSSIQAYRSYGGKRAEVLHLIGWIVAFAIISYSDNMLHHTPVLWVTAVWWGAMFAHLHDRKQYANFLLNA